MKRKCRLFSGLQTQNRTKSLAFDVCHSQNITKYSLNYISPSPLLPPPLSLLPSPLLPSFLLISSPLFPLSLSHIHTNICTNDFVCAFFWLISQRNQANIDLIQRLFLKKQSFIFLRRRCLNCFWNLSSNLIRVQCVASPFKHEVAL